MTIYELHIYLNDAVDKISSNAVPEFTHTQRDRALNIGIETFIKNRYGHLSNNKQQGFEEVQKRVDDLSNLVVYLDLTPSGSGYIQTNKVSCTKFNFPTDYWFTVLEGIIFKMPLCNPVKKVDICDGEETILETHEEVFAPVKERRHNEVNALLTDTFHRPQDTDCFRVIRDNVLELYHDKNVEPLLYKFGYIQQFKKVEVNKTYQITNSNNPNFWQTTEFWMNPHTHLEIVELAALWLLEGVSDPRFQSYMNKVATQE